MAVGTLNLPSVVKVNQCVAAMLANNVVILSLALLLIAALGIAICAESERLATRRTSNPPKPDKYAVL